MLSSISRAKGIIFLILVPFIFVFGAVRDYLLRSSSRDEPQVIRCEDLGQNGPGDNIHVTVTDFIIGSPAIHEGDKRGRGDWPAIWVPVLPLGGRYHHTVARLLDANPNAKVPKPVDFFVLVKLPDAKKEDIDALAQRSSITGMVINEVEIMGAVGKLIGKTFPAVLLDRCWLVDSGLSPPGLVWIVIRLIIGCALAVWIVRVWWRSRRPAAESVGSDPVLDGAELERECPGAPLPSSSP